MVGWVVVDCGGIGVVVGFKSFVDFGVCFELVCSDYDLGVVCGLIFKCCEDGRGGGVGGVFDKGDVGVGEERYGFDCVD